MFFAVKRLVLMKLCPDHSQKQHRFVCFLHAVKYCSTVRWIFAKFSNDWQKIKIAELCEGVHCVGLGESFPTNIWLQSLASIQPRTSLVKFARSPRTDPSGGHRRSSELGPGVLQELRWAVRWCAVPAGGSKLIFRREWREAVEVRRGRPRPPQVREEMNVSKFNVLIY